MSTFVEKLFALRDSYVPKPDLEQEKYLCDTKIYYIKGELTNAAKQGYTELTVSSTYNDYYLKEYNTYFTDIINQKNGSFYFDWSHECTNEFGKSLKVINECINKNKNLIDSWVEQWAVTNLDKIKEKVVQSFDTCESSGDAAFVVKHFFIEDKNNLYIYFEKKLEQILCKLLDENDIVKSDDFVHVKTRDTNNDNLEIDICVQV